MIRIITLLRTLSNKLMVPRGIPWRRVVTTCRIYKVLVNRHCNRRCNSQKDTQLLIKAKFHSTELLKQPVRCNHRITPHSSPSQSSLPETGGQAPSHAVSSLEIPIVVQTSNEFIKAEFDYDLNAKACA